MGYRKFRADYLFTGNDMLDSSHLLITDAGGSIVEIIADPELTDDVEIFEGILSPGFINCHCHLELSHMKGLIPERTGLIHFVQDVMGKRHFSDDAIATAIEKAENEMHMNGIAGVGDICNTKYTLEQKEKKRLAYYNFIEVSGWAPAVAESRFLAASGLYESFRNRSLRVSLTPHAPYSVSGALWKKLKPGFTGNAVSIHSQETIFEDELFKSGTGAFNKMYEMMKIRNDSFKPAGKSSLQTCLPEMKSAGNILLVHNTFIAENDIIAAVAFKKALYFCLCVNANQYIENALPPVDLLLKHTENIVVGTDSLASNHQLSILEEIKTIRKHFPGIPTATLLSWSTRNGAKALMLDSILGSFAPGKQPDIVLIEHTKGPEIVQESAARRIL